MQEIGCSKLQSFYFSKPVPLNEAIAYYRTHEQTGYENPNEANYYGLLCSVNLYDVSVIAREEKGSFQNTYSTLPMCIIEVKDNRTRFLRTNQSYRDFVYRFFGFDISELGPEFVEFNDAFMHNVVKTCCEQRIGATIYGAKLFFKEQG